MENIDHVDLTLLLLDDDTAFLPRLAMAMELRGNDVRQAPDVATGLRMIESDPPAYAVVDLRLLDGTGLDVVSKLRELRPTARSIVLTGYGNIVTAVGAVKAGADDYLAKPADADEIDLMLRNKPGDKAQIPEHMMSVDRVRWEHIQSVFQLYGFNISETARRLNMHRRTLQRILSKGEGEPRPAIERNGHH
jgi:two-component system, response regulator RegA